MKPETSKAIRKLHALLQQVAAEVAAIRPLLEEEEERRLEVSRLLNRRTEMADVCPATEAADLDAARRADIWRGDLADAMNTLDNLDFPYALETIVKQADLAAFMLANRSSVFGLFSDDDTRVFELAGMARNALPDAPRYALDATARAVLALPADVAYPVEVANG
jgi:hypothetical protein